jgi:hypothetical protein
MAALASSVEALTVGSGDSPKKGEPSVFLDKKVVGVVLCPKEKAKELPEFERYDVATNFEKYKTELRELKKKLLDVIPEAKPGPDDVMYDNNFFVRPPRPPSSIDIDYDDLFLLRYLLSKKGDVAKAENMVRKCIAWRARKDVRLNVFVPVAEDTWREADTKRRLDKHMVFGPFSNLIDGGSLVYLRDGLGAGNTVYESVSKDEFLWYGIIAREYCFRWIDRESRRLSRIVKSMYMFDMTDAALNTIPNRSLRGVYGTIASISEYAYPQLVSKYLIVNPPYFISFLLGLFRPVVPASMYEKIELFPSAVPLAKSDFAKQWMHQDWIPEFMDGTFPDKDLPKCLTGELVQHGEDASLTEVNVGRMDSKVLTIDVPDAPAKIEYRFSTTKTIGLSATFHAVSKAGKEIREEQQFSDKVYEASTAILHPPKRIDTGNGLYHGTWEVDCPGVITITLDNKFSYLTAKTVKYKIIPFPLRRNEKILPQEDS